MRDNQEIQIWDMSLIVIFRGLFLFSRGAIELLKHHQTFTARDFRRVCGERGIRLPTLQKSLTGGQKSQLSQAVIVPLKRVGDSWPDSKNDSNETECM